MTNYNNKQINNFKILNNMISKGNASKEAQEFKRYIGVCPVTIKVINPNKTEHEKLFNTKLEENPVYIQDREDSNGNTFRNARISLILQPDVEKTGFDMPLITMSLFVSNQKQFGANSGKYQVVDKYGRFAWATESDITNKQIPTYSNGKKADIDSDYRIAYVGEEDLTNFIRVFLCIPNITKWDNNERCMVINNDVKPEECECRLDVASFENMFKGDFSDIQDILGYQPTNKIKICLGVRTDANTGRLYQTVYNKKFLSNAATNYNSLEKMLQQDITYAQEHNKSLNTEYSSEFVHEYKVTPTTFEPSKEVVPNDLPFSDNDSDPFGAF